MEWDFSAILDIDEDDHPSFSPVVEFRKVLLENGELSIPDFFFRLYMRLYEMEQIGDTLGRILSRLMTLTGPILT